MKDVRWQTKGGRDHIRIPDLLANENGTEGMPMFIKSTQLGRKFREVE